MSTPETTGARPIFHRHVLRGCAPRPLSNYLRALGVLRVIAEQTDSSARGYWHDEAFVLMTRLDERALVEFFLHRWRPSPFVSPWNKASGLLGDDPKGVGPIERTTASRFEPLREAIQMAKVLTAEMKAAVTAERDVKEEANRITDKADREARRNDPEYKQRLAHAAKACKTLKDELQPACQRRWRGPALRWLKAAVVIGSDGDAKFPALLGTGGNDGKLDFTNNAMQRLGDLFDLKSADGEPREGAEIRLRAALLGETAPGLLVGGIGQFAPAASGGANSTSGPLGKSLLNPWELPLLLEGALLFAAGTSRRLGGASSAQTAAPFSARSWSVGYGSAAAADEGARGEQWMPLWTRPWRASEVAALLAEGRCQLGSSATDSAMDVARAIARLGVARGVTAFERYGYIERNGKSNYAVPLGRWTVRVEPRARLLDDLDTDRWWARIKRAAGDSNAPASLARLERALGHAAMSALAHGSESARWQTVLLALAELEAQLVESGAYAAAKRLGPIPRLSVDWIAAIDDGGIELPLALALAGAGAGHSHKGSPVDAARRHWLPLDPFGRRFATREGGLVHDPRVVMTARRAESDLIALVQRRLVEAQSSRARTFPLRARWGTAASVAEIAALVREEVDLDRTLWLARALSALDWESYDPSVHRPRHSSSRAFGSPVDPAWAALRLCHLAVPILDDGRRIPVDPAVLRLLSSGDTSRAFALVLQRLRGVGIAAPFSAVSLPPAIARRMAASLAFPISDLDAGHLVRALEPHRAPGV